MTAAGGAVRIEALHDRYLVVFERHGKRHEVYPLPSVEEARLVADAMALKAAVDDGRDPAELPLLSTPGRVHLSVEAAAAVRSTSFAHAVEELCLAAEAMYSTRGRTDPFYLPPAQSSERIGSWYIEEDPGEVDREGRRNTTLVHEAAQDNRLAALRLLLAVAPASAWAARSRQWLPIDLALCRRHTDAVQLLLATMPAAGLGADEVAELLLEAARSRQWNAMHMLLDAAAPGSLSSLATDVRARLLLGAAGSDSLRLLQTILDACPDAAALHSLYGSETPLQRAAAAGQSAAVDLLFEALPGIAAAIPEGSSWTQLHMAAACGAASEAQALLASHPEAALERTGQEETALHLAAACGRESVVRLLLEAAPQAAALAMRTGATACELAVQHGHAGTLAVLLPAAPEAAIAAALRRACSNGCEAAVQAILAAAPDAVLLRQEGQLPIHAAAEAGHASILERLLAVAPGTASAVVERQGYRGGTGDSPLHLAAGRCQLAAGRCPCAAQRSP